MEIKRKCFDFMLAGKTLIDHTTLFPPYDLEKKNDINEVHKLTNNLKK